LANHFNVFCQADVKRVLWSVYHPLVDKVEWCQKGTRRLTFEQGTYRFPLHIPFPQTNIPPSISRYSPPLYVVCVRACRVVSCTRRCLSNLPSPINTQC